MPAEMRDRLLDSSDAQSKLAKNLLKVPNIVLILVSDALSINERSEFRTCCLHFFVSCSRVSLSLVRAERTDLPRRLASLGDKIDSLFTYLMNASMHLDESIFILRYQYEKLRHQQSLALYRKNPLTLVPPNLERLTCVISDFSASLPNSYSSLFYSAIYLKYLFQWRKATNLADSALLGLGLLGRRSWSWILLLTC